MECPHCHRIIENDSVFCPYCGTHITNIVMQRPQRPYAYQMAPTTNPHKITKKAKEVLAGLFAVIVIGGIAVHHIHSMNSPQSVNLNKALNNHVITSSTLNGHKYCLNNVIHGNVLGGSDAQLGSDAKIVLSNGSIGATNPSDNTGNSDSDTNPIGYTVTKHTFTLVNNGTPDSDGDYSDTTSYAGNKVTFKLGGVSDNGHHLILDPYSFTQASDNGGVPHIFSKKFQHNKKVDVHVGKKINPK